MRKFIISFIFLLSALGIYVFLKRTEPPVNASVVNLQNQASSTNALPSAQTKTPQITPKAFTLRGLVMLKTSNNLGELPLNYFVLSDGKTSYKVIVDNATSRYTKVVNLKGREVGNNFIQVGNYVTVTGPLNGTVINAQTIVVETNKDEGA